MKKSSQFLTKQNPQTTHHLQGSQDPETEKVDIFSDSEKKIINAQKNALFQLEKAHEAHVRLSTIRLQSKLSNTRVAGVARELRELIKVMSVYA